MPCVYANWEKMGVEKQDARRRQAKAHLNTMREGRLWRSGRWRQVCRRRPAPVLLVEGKNSSFAEPTGNEQGAATGGRDVALNCETAVVRQSHEHAKCAISEIPLRTCILARCRWHFERL